MAHYAWTDVWASQNFRWPTGPLPVCSWLGGGIFRLLQEQIGLRQEKIYATFFSLSSSTLLLCSLYPPHSSYYVVLLLLRRPPALSSFSPLLLSQNRREQQQKMSVTSYNLQEILLCVPLKIPSGAAPICTQRFSHSRRNNAATCTQSWNNFSCTQS